MIKNNYTLADIFRWSAFTVKLEQRPPTTSKRLHLWSDNDEGFRHALSVVGNFSRARMETKYKVKQLHLWKEQGTTWMAIVEVDKDEV